MKCHYHHLSYGIHQCVSVVLHIGNKFSDSYHENKCSSSDGHDKGPDGTYMSENVHQFDKTLHIFDSERMAILI